MLAVRMDSRQREEIGLEVSAFGDIDGGIDGGNLREAHVGPGVYQARIDVQALCAQSYRSSRDIDGLADFFDLSILDQNRSGGNVRPIQRVDRGADNRVGMS